MAEDLCRLSISELAPLLSRREVSPVEAVEAFLARITAVDSTLNSFITVDEEGARAQAKDAEARLARGETGPLLGVPLSIKDILATKGLRTTCGSRILENYAPPFDATVCARLRRAGAVFLGKTNMDEFAMGSSTENSGFGVTHNPWRQDLYSGGQQRGVGRGGGRGPVHRVGGLGHRRFHPPARVPLRRGGIQADLWTGVPLRPGGLCFVPGPGGSGHQGSPGRGPAAKCPGRP